MTVPTQAVILAAGEGRRLRPYTDVRPKPLMPFLNVPLLRHSLRLAARSGVRRVWVNAWHLAQQVVDYVATRPEPALEVTVVVEEKLLGTGGGLANLWPRMERAPLLLLLSDIVADFDIEALCDHHRRQHLERGACATMALTAAADPAVFGAVHADRSGRLTDIAGLCDGSTVQDAAQSASHEATGDARREAAGDAGSRGFVNASAHVFEPEFLDRLPRTPSCFIRQGYVPAMDDGMTCVGWQHEGAWYDTGTPAALLDAQEAALSGALPVDDALFAAGGRRHGARGFVHEAAEVADDVQLEAGTTVAQGCLIESGVRLRHCLVLPDTHVAAGTVEEGVILGGLAEPTARTSAEVSA